MQRIRDPNDNLLDIIALFSGIYFLSVLSGYGDGNFTDIVLFLKEYGINFNRNRFVDTATVDASTNSASLTFGCRNASFTKPIYLTLDFSSGLKSVSSRGLNNDD